MVDTNKVLGLCNLYNSPSIGSLNDKRALGAVTFGGRFALMDFCLSNFTNSGIDKVGILVKSNPQSVLSHTEGGLPWVRNTKTGFEYLLYNEAEIPTSKRNTALSNLEANKVFLEHETDSIEYFVISPSNFIMCMDFRPILESHVSSGCPITVVYAPIHEGKTLFLNADVIKIREDGSLESMMKNNKKKDEVLCCVETFIINRSTMEDMLERCKTYPELDVKDIIKIMAEKENVKINTFGFEHFVLPITNFNEYISSSFRMLKFESKRKLFKTEWPIYTTTHDTPPAKYGPNAEVSDSTISNGCKIYGKVEHSILSRNVVVEEGAVVKNCILFNGTVVGKNTKLNGIITDKRVKISANKKLKGDLENFPNVISTGTEI